MDTYSNALNKLKLEHYTPHHPTHPPKKKNKRGWGGEMKNITADVYFIFILISFI
jgi:hypothetical protein